MKVFYKFIALGLIGIGMTGCFHSKVSYVNLEDSKEYTSTGIDYHDIEATIHKSVQSLLQSEYVATLDGKKVLAISDVTNDTMQQVDVYSLTAKIARSMRKSGKFELTSAVGGSGTKTDSMIQKNRELRDNEEFNQYTTIERGNLIAPSLSLSGVITQNNRKVGKKQRIDYSFTLTLTDLKTGIVKWDESMHIIKVAPNNRVSW